MGRVVLPWFGFYLKRNPKPPERPSQARPLGLRRAGSSAAPAKGGSHLLQDRRRVAGPTAGASHLGLQDPMSILSPVTKNRSPSPWKPKLPFCHRSLLLSRGLQTSTWGRCLMSVLPAGEQDPLPAPHRGQRSGGPALRSAHGDDTFPQEPPAGTAPDIGPASDTVAVASSNSILLSSQRAKFHVSTSHTLPQRPPVAHHGRVPTVARGWKCRSTQRGSRERGCFLFTHHQHMT